MKTMSEDLIIQTGLAILITNGFRNELSVKNPDRVTHSCFSGIIGNIKECFRFA